MDFTNYFESKLGTKIVRRYVTGDDFYTGIYERRYTVEVLVVDKDKGQAVVTLTKIDYTPSGYVVADTTAVIGEDAIQTKGETMEGILDGYIRRKDPEFFNQYPKVTGK